jgi:integrase
MASYRRYAEGWRAEVFRRGVRDSKTFFSKGEAVAWAGRREAEIMAGVRGDIPNFSVSALLERYEADVTPAKKGKRWESIRLQALRRDPLAAVRLRQLDTPHVSEWQKRRLKAVSGASVRRERNLLNAVFNTAVIEWKWLHRNPFGERGRAVRRPKDSKPRNRVASAEEQAKLLERSSPSMRRAITIALETAMRCKEIASNPPIKGRVAYLEDSKTGEGRAVPLSPKALEAWKVPIDITAGSISSLFARLCDDCEIKGLTFHDLKHTAMTRLSKRLDPWELAKMTGNKDMNLLLKVYYHHDPEKTADKL